MSNYLANLAARSVQKETPLQPRPLSLFEPWPVAGMGALPAPIAPVAGEEGEVWQTTVSPSPPPPPLVPPTVTVPQRVWQTVVQPAYMSPNPLPPTHGPEQPPPSTTILREIVRPETSAPAPLTVPLSPTFITTTLHAAAQLQPIQPATLPPAVSPLPPATYPQPATGDDRSDKSPSSPLITTTPDIVIPPTLSANPSIHNSQFTPSASSRQAVHHTPFSIPPEPTPIIQVTIGRIEVRATPPPSAPREKRQSPSPTMNLDDYLRQRNGGQR